MAISIEDYVKERRIKYLVHFTKEENFSSIFQRGLVARDTLEKEGFVNFNDRYRYDGTNAVCLSIGFPNYRMFYRLRQETPDTSWVVIGIRPSVLWERKVVFCSSNAASSRINDTSIESRMGIFAFKKMYDDCGEKTRSCLGIQVDYPTNPQAEVLVLNGVPREYIFGIGVPNSNARQRLLERYPNFNVKVCQDFFYPRSDWTHWQEKD